MRVEEKRRTGVGIADDEAIVVDGDGGDADDDDGRVWWWIICGVVAGWWWWMVLVHGVGHALDSDERKHGQLTERMWQRASWHCSLPTQ